ncbi:MAG: hypothetical protein WBP79_02590 [Candidatus Acidiferrales bacterium]
MLLLAVAGLSTVAKNSQYFPKSSPARFINIASKMKAAQSPVVVDRQPLEPVAKVDRTRPIYRVFRQDEPETPLMQLIGLVVSLQHRSPPVPLI